MVMLSDLPYGLSQELAKSAVSESLSLKDVAQPGPAVQPFQTGDVRRRRFQARRRGVVDFHPDALGDIRRFGRVMDVDRLVIGIWRHVGQGQIAKANQVRDLRAGVSQNKEFAPTGGKLGKSVEGDRLGGGRKNLSD